MPTANWRVAEPVQLQCDVILASSNHSYPLHSIDSDWIIVTYVRLSRPVYVWYFTKSFLIHDISAIKNIFGNKIFFF